MNNATPSLFHRSGFIGGILSLVDFRGYMHTKKSQISQNIIDTQALTSDWVVVGHDLRNAIEQYERGIRKS